MIMLNKYETDDHPIKLEDRSSGSYAEYLRNNPSRALYIYFKPDEEETTEPRCDYLLCSPEPGFAARFIELKGGDIPRQAKCCKTEWDHAFHQLLSTFNKLSVYLEPTEEAIFVLSTSIERKRISARFTQYRYYKKLQAMLHDNDTVVKKILILYENEDDQY